MVLKYRPEPVPSLLNSLRSVSAVYKIQCRQLGGVFSTLHPGASAISSHCSPTSTLNSRALKLLTCPAIHNAFHKLLLLPGASFSSCSWSAWHTSSFILQDCFNSAFSVRPSIATQLVFLSLWIPLATLPHSLAMCSPSFARQWTF